MSPLVLVPAAVVLVVAMAVTATHRRLPPSLACKLAVVSLVVVVAGAAVPTLWVLAFGYVAHLPVLGDGFDWLIRTLGLHAEVGEHSPVPVWAGLPALVLIVVGVARAWRVARMYRRLRVDRCGSIEVAEHPRPFAYTLPGSGGHVVVSTALVDLLDDGERMVVLAHERAHGEHRHDRLLLIAQLARAVVPFVWPLARRLEFSIERWADEQAALACGDRGLVARTLGKLALHDAGPAGALSFGGLGAPARVCALLAPPAARPRSVELVWMAGGVVATAALCVVQLHGLAAVVVALCPW